MFNIFTTNDNKIACFKVKLNWTKVVGSGQFDYSVYPVLPFEILSSQRVGRPSLHLLKVVWWGGGGGGGGGGLFDYSVYLWPRFVKV